MRTSDNKMRALQRELNNPAAFGTGVRVYNRKRHTKSNLGHSTPRYFCTRHGKYYLSSPFQYGEKFNSPWKLSDFLWRPRGLKSALYLFATRDWSFKWRFQKRKNKAWRLVHQDVSHLWAPRFPTIPKDDTCQTFQIHRIQLSATTQGVLRDRENFLLSSSRHIETFRPCT